jgi:hypothetical protein
VTYASPRACELVAITDGLVIMAVADEIAPAA